jgi:predicted dehydrogenase
VVKCGCTRRLGLPANEWFQIKEFSGGGVLIDLGVHFIDIVMYFMNYPKPISISAHQYNKFGGGPLAELYAFEHGGKPDWRYDVEDLIIGNIELEGDIHVSYELSWASNIPKGETYWELYGTKGNIRFNNGEILISTVVNGQFADVQPVIRPHMYRETEFAHFVNCVKTGKAPTIAILEQGVKAMKIIDGIYKAADEKKQIVF